MDVYALLLKIPDNLTLFRDFSFVNVFVWSTKKDWKICPYSTFLLLPLSRFEFPVRVVKNSMKQSPNWRKKLKKLKNSSLKISTPKKACQ